MYSEEEAASQSWCWEACAEDRTRLLVASGYLECALLAVTLVGFVLEPVPFS